MRLEFSLIALAGLAACTVAPTPAAQPATTETPAPFNVPMDPGQIRCASLRNPIALSEATQWTLGRARAAVLSGRLPNVPSAETISQNLTGYCGSNPTNTLEMAADQFGV